MGRRTQTPERIVNQLKQSLERIDALLVRVKSEVASERFDDVDGLLTSAQEIYNQAVDGLKLDELCEEIRETANELVELNQTIKKVRINAFVLQVNALLNQAKGLIEADNITEALYFLNRAKCQLKLLLECLDTYEFSESVEKARNEAKEFLQQVTSMIESHELVSIPTPIDSRIATLRNFELSLSKFSVQLAALRRREASATENEQLELEEAITIAQRVLDEMLVAYHDYTTDASVTMAVFKEQCTRTLNQDDVNDVLGRARGDWSFTRLLGELARTLMTLVGYETTAAPRFFKTTTQSRADDLQSALDDLDLNDDLDLDDDRISLSTGTSR